MRALLEEGAREEDEGLRDKWANLLANGLAAGAEGVPRAYAEVLRQLEPVEAVLLERIAKGNVLAQGTQDGGTRMLQGEMEGLPPTALVNLERMGLLRLTQPPLQGRVRGVQSLGEPLRGLGLTTFGIDFVKACQESEPPS